MRWPGSKDCLFRGCVTRLEEGACGAASTSEEDTFHNSEFQLDSYSHVFAKRESQITSLRRIVREPAIVSVADPRKPSLGPVTSLARIVSSECWLRPLP